MSTDTLDAESLKKKILDDLYDGRDYWGERKDKHPYEIDPDYFFECKDNREAFGEGIWAVEKICSSGTLEQFKKGLASALEKQNPKPMVLRRISAIVFSEQGSGGRLSPYSKKSAG